MRPQYFCPEKSRASRGQNKLLAAVQSGDFALRIKWQRNFRLFGTLIILLLASCDAFAQIQQAWVARYNNGIANGTNQAVKMTLDAAGNIYVVGVSQNTNTNLGYVTIKYAPNGNQLWASRFDSTNYPTATPAALVIDNSNYAVVTGNALTIKYDTNGNQLWTAPYAGYALGVDTSGNSVLTFGTGFDAVKLGPTGATLWHQRNPSSCGNALGQAVVVDSGGNIYVAGSYPDFCNDGLINSEFLVIKYNPSGTEVWSTSYDDGGSPWQAVGELVDGVGDVYVGGNFTGEAGSKYIVFGVNPAGNQIWIGGPFFNVNDVCYSVAIDQSQCLLMTGRVLGNSSFVYGTAKLGTNGSTLWTSYYPSNLVGPSVANAIATDHSNNSYVTGYSAGINGTNNIVTIKYGPNGNQLWLQSYNGLNAGNDSGNAIAVDNSGNVYVTGYETLPGGGTGIVTIKYAPLSIQRQTNGTVLIETQGSPGESFDIQASSDLLNWLDLGTILADTNGLLQFDDTNAPNFPARFYYTNPR